MIVNIITCNLVYLQQFFLHDSTRYLKRNIGMSRLLDQIKYRGELIMFLRNRSLFNIQSCRNLVCMILILRFLTEKYDCDLGQIVFMNFWKLFNKVAFLVSIFNNLLHQAKIQKFFKRGDEKERWRRQYLGYFHVFAFLLFLLCFIAGFLFCSNFQISKGCNPMTTLFFIIQSYNPGTENLNQNYAIKILQCLKNTWNKKYQFSMEKYKCTRLLQNTPLFPLDISHFE